MKREYKRSYIKMDDDEFGELMGICKTQRTNLADVTTELLKSYVEAYNNKRALWRRNDDN